MLLDRLLTNLDVRVGYFTLCRVGEGWRLALPGPPAVMLHFVLRGRGAIRDPEGRLQELAPCGLAVVPRGAVHALESAVPAAREVRIEPPPEGVSVPQCLVAGPLEETTLDVACGVVQVRYGESIGLFDRLGRIVVVDLSGCAGVSAAFEALIAEQSNPQPGGEALKSVLMSQCLVHLLRRLSNEADPPFPWLPILEDPRLGRALERILEDPGAPHTVDSLAGFAAMSRSAFAKHFSTAFGRPPMSLLHQIRMQRAARLLRQGGAIPIETVAQRVGYASRSHFSRAFKKHYGRTPVAHREQPHREQELSARDMALS